MRAGAGGLGPDIELGNRCIDPGFAWRPTTAAGNGFRFLTALMLRPWREEAMSEGVSDLFTYVIVAVSLSGVAMWFSLRARNERQ